MPADPLIHEMWPHLGALVDTLEGLENTSPAATDALLDALLAKLNRPGGPKISSRAIV